MNFYPIKKFHVYVSYQTSGNQGSYCKMDDVQTFCYDPSLSITPAAKRQCQRSLQVTLQCLSHEGIWGVGLTPEHDVDTFFYLQLSASGLTCGDSRNWIIWLCISPNPTSRSVSEKSVQLCSIAQVERRPFSARSRSKSTPREATVGKLQAGLAWDHPATIDVSCFPSWDDDLFFIIVRCTFSLGMAWMCRVPTYSPKLRPTGPTYSPKTPQAWSNRPHWEPVGCQPTAPRQIRRWIRGWSSRCRPVWEES